MKSKSPITTRRRTCHDQERNASDSSRRNPVRGVYEASRPPINANRLAKALEVPANRITAIIKGQRGITGDTAVRLATLFDTTAEFWLNLQKTYELRLAEQALPGKVRKHIEQSRVVLVSA